MGIGSKLKMIMDDRGLKVSELSELTHLPAQTIYSLISRDSNKVSIDALLTICNALSLSVEDFYNFDLTESAENSQDAFRLSDHEKDVMNAYRNADKTVQDGVDRFLGIEPLVTEQQAKKIV